MTDADREACVDYSVAELIRTGTTTVMELGGMGNYVADAVEQAGLRAYIGDMYASASWVSDGKQVGYQWDEARGLDASRGLLHLSRKSTDELTTASEVSSVRPR